MNIIRFTAIDEVRVALIGAITSIVGSLGRPRMPGSGRRGTRDLFDFEVSPKEPRYGATPYEVALFDDALAEEWGLTVDKLLARGESRWGVIANMIAIGVPRHILGDILSPFGLNKIHHELDPAILNLMWGFVSALLSAFDRPLIDGDPERLQSIDATIGALLVVLVDCVNRVLGQIDVDLVGRVDRIFDKFDNAPAT